MNFFIGLVLCSLCVNLSAASEAYRAAAIGANNGITPNSYASFIHEAAKANVDILVLPSSELTESEDNYDETVKAIATATKQAGLYVVAHLFEKARCQNKMETIRSNLVFDRQGSIVTVYRKPTNNIANCTAMDSDLVTFATDFGVNFGLLMEEDIVLRSAADLNGVKNFVMSGGVAADIPFLSAAQFLPSWSYVSKANLISSVGIFAGKTTPKAASDKLVIADIGKDSSSDIIKTVPLVNTMKLNSFPGEDLSHYIIKPLNVEASTHGYKETVCHKSFCCEFRVKTSVTGPKPSDVNYGLAAFDGVRHYSGSHNIGTQNCAVFACAGLYKRSCDVGSENNSTNMIFDNISIIANFTKRRTAQYPVIQSTDALSSDGFKFDITTISRSKQVTAEIHDIQNLLTFGIFGRDFSKDFETESVSGQRNNTEGLTDDIYDFFFNEDVQEFFDYLWIRLRVLMFIVSIYILEMM